MNRSMIRSLGVVFASAVVALWPLVAGAQSAPTATISADELRAEFVRQGYQVDKPITWSTSDNVTTFRVYDPAQQSKPTGRVLMVLVYPDAATAQAEVDRAAAREAADGTLASSGTPHLVPGFGPGVLRLNVAMVQSTYQELQNRDYSESADAEAPVVVCTNSDSDTGCGAPLVASPVMYAVDSDFQPLVVVSTQVDL